MEVFSLFQSLSVIIVVILSLTELRSPNKGEKSVRKNTLLPSFDLGLILSTFITQICVQMYYTYRWWEAVLNGSSVEVLRSDEMFLMGLLVFGIGKYLRTRAKQELGKFYTYEIGMNEKQKLIKTGLYTYLMHPSYLGGFLMCIGPCFMYVSTMLCGISILHLGALLNRIRIEEKMLHASFGKEFEQYKSERWRMLPYAY